MHPRIPHLVLAGLAALPLAAAPAAAQWMANGVPVCAAAGDQSATRAVGDGAGGAILVWVDARSGEPDLYAKRIVSNGYTAPGWPATGAPVCTAAGAQVVPDIASDGAGGAFVAWQDSRNGAGDTDVYLQRITADGSVAPGWPTDGLAVCDTTDVQANPVVVADGAGGAIVVWLDYRSGFGLDVFAARVSATGQRRWARQGVPVCRDTLDQTGAVCAPDGAGGVFVAWEDARYSTNVIPVADIYVQHLGSGGAPASGWPVNGLPATPSSGLRFAYAPTIAGDGSGGAIVAWEDYRNISSGIYALRFDAGGAVPAGWTVGGSVVCDTTGDQVGPQAAADGSGGVVVVWQDYRAGSTRDLYAQRVSAAGARAAGWPSAGAPVCTAAGEQAAPRIVSDGDGGAVVTWYDYRSGNETDIFAQHLTGAGAVTPGWSANGLVLCNAPGDQQSPALVADIAPAAGGGSGCIVAWADHRNGVDYDIYAQRVTGQGVVAPTVDVPAGPAPVFRMLEPRPNPAAGATALGFELPAERAVEARVFDAAGRVVRTLAAGATLSAGTHRLVWDGRDEGGRPVAAGVYLVRLVAGDEAQVRRVVRLR